MHIIPNSSSMILGNIFGIRIYLNIFLQQICAKKKKKSDLEEAQFNIFNKRNGVNCDFLQNLLNLCVFLP